MTKSGAIPAAAIVKRMVDCPAYRISPADTNYFALVFDMRGEGFDIVVSVEIFQPGGKTPPNVHQRAHEMFFVLEGRGLALCDGISAPIAKGDALLVRPGHTHVVENTGPGKLYCLAVMVPNEDFAELIRRGTPVTLAPEDRQALTGG